MNVSFHRCLLPFLSSLPEVPFCLGLTPLETSEKNTEQEAFFKKNNQLSQPSLFFHTVLITLEYIAQMVGCIFAEDFFFSSQVHRHDLEFVILYS